MGGGGGGKGQKSLSKIDEEELGVLYMVFLIIWKPHSLKRELEMWDEIEQTSS